MFLIPALQDTPPTGSVLMDVIKFMAIVIAVLVSGGVIFTGGVLVFAYTLIRATRNNPDALVTIKKLVDSLERSHPGIAAQLDNAGNVLEEGGKLLDDVTGNTPPPADPTVKTITITASSAPAEPGKLG